VNLANLQEKLPEWRERIKSVRQPEPEGWTWYGYDILGNVDHLNGIVSDETRQLLNEQGTLRIADIGCADGDLGLLLASEGHSVDLIDWPLTNWNGLRGAPLLKSRLDLDVGIHEVDLDSQFRLPAESYDFIFLLGILYHLKNPYYVLETLARHTRYCAISTRIARFARPLNANDEASELDVSELPVAYLLNPDECNNDATNFWIFSLAGLRRLVQRSGWRILDEGRLGSEESNPSDNDRDERAFMILESTRFEHDR
jgi:tRNA (mo5U34)-methyltransferase